MIYRPNKKIYTIETLANRFFIFSNSLDLACIKMYIDVGYKVIFKKDNNFYYISESKVLDPKFKILKDLKLCSKQDIKNCLSFLNR